MKEDHKLIEQKQSETKGVKEYLNKALKVQIHHLMRQRSFGLF